MDSKIEIRLKAYQSRENIELFFDVVNKLITELGITNDNPRFCLNARNENGSNRISVNLNSRLISGLRNEEDSDYIIFMFYIKDIEVINSKGIELISMGKFYNQTNEVDKAETFLINIDSFKKYKEEIISLWLKACKDYFPLQTTSQYRKHHLPELFELVVNENYRTKELNRILNNYNMDFFKKSDLEYYSHVMLNDKKYRADNKESIEKGAIIKKTIFDKTNYWAKMICEKNNELSYEEDNKWQLSGNIKGYSWVRINLVENKNSKVFFTIGVSGINKNLLIKLDCQRGNADKLNEDEILKFDDLKESLKIEDLIIQDNILETYNWEKLVFETLEYIKKYIDKYKLINKELFGIIPNPMKSEIMTHPLNQIFYGSPGTGKTFNTINNAISLLENIPLEILNKESRTALKGRYDKAISDGKIVFSTFHQNMNYEDFIEGIKPQKPKSDDSFLKYEIKDGIFKKLCKTALESLLFNYESKKQINTLNNTFSFEEYFNKYLSHIKNVLASNDKYIVKQLYGSEVQVVNVSESGTFELRYLSKIGDIKNEDYRPTLSKSYLQKLYDSGNPPSYFVGNIRVKMKDIAGSCAHPSPYYAIYNDFYIFINGNFILDEIGEKEEVSIKEELSYEELVRRFAEYKIPKDEILSIVKENKYVIIIDEINRGNVSAIFGELITLIETDKRLGMDEYITLQLPYSKEVFSVPPNVYILGTMNTADRSVEALDTALRRRFHFVEMPPKVEVVYSDYVDYFLYLVDTSTLEKWNNEKSIKEENEYAKLVIGKFDSELIYKAGNDLKMNTESLGAFVEVFQDLGIRFLHVEVLKIINERIEYLLNSDHTIGHSYFLNITSIEELKETMFKNIIPLLQEYFYGDYKKLAMVIGDDFFTIKESDNKPTWAKVNDEIETTDKDIYQLKTISEMKDNDVFILAIKNLINE